MLSPSNARHRGVLEMVNQQRNIRSFRVHCKSFTAHEDMCKINPCRTKQFKKYIMKQLAKRGRKLLTVQYGKNLYMYYFFNESVL